MIMKKTVGVFRILTSVENEKKIRSFCFLNDLYLSEFFVKSALDYIEREEAKNVEA